MRIPKRIVHIAQRALLKLAKTGIVSAFLVTLGNVLGITNRRRLLSFLGLIPRTWPDFLSAVERKASALPTINSIDRISNADGETFRSKYAAEGIPVIIAAEEPTISWDSFRKEYGDIELKTRQGGDYDKMQRKSSKLDDYVGSMLAGEGTYYMGNNRLPQRMSTSRLVLPPPFVDPETFSYDRAQIWIGGPPTGAHLHRDHTDNFVYVLLGQKKFWLCAPNESDSLYTWEVHRSLTSSKVNAAEPDYRKYPKARSVNFVSVTLNPGDWLYIPCCWWHQVHNDVPSCSINFFGKIAVAACPEWQDKARKALTQQK